MKVLSKVISLTVSRSTGLFVALAVPIAFAAPAQALVIDPIFNSTITSLSDASQVEAAINQAIGVYESDLKSNVTIEIEFSWGTIDGSAVASDDASESLAYLYTGFTYSELSTYLKQAAAANPTDTALVTAAAHLPATSPTGLSNYAITEAEAAALGLIPPTPTSIDGYVGFSSKLSYSLNPASTPAGEYDLVALAEHEMSEVMGRLSGLSSSKPTYATTYDLFRYSAAGKPSFSYSSAAYFSINGGVTNLGAFNDTGGGDRGDWLNTAGATDEFDSEASTGANMNLSQADLTALDALGWDTANNPGGWVTSSTASSHSAQLAGDVPEPGAWVMMILGIAPMGAMLRRRRRSAVSQALV
jgi:hypothetical protein